jgi:hypothetical protein
VRRACMSAQYLGCLPGYFLEVELSLTYALSNH